MRVLTFIMVSKSSTAVSGCRRGPVTFLCGEQCVDVTAGQKTWQTVIEVAYF